MATRRFLPSSFPLSAVALAALTASGTAFAETTTLPPVTVTGRSDPPVAVSGWGDIPLSVSPLQASVLSSSLLRDRGAQRLADTVRTDASVSDAYNSEGYWDFIAIRGFTLDNRFNFRRDGLPISAETLLPLDNKERVEILKGVTGIQAGTSAPGGLMNLVVKRPTDAPLREVSLGWRERNSWTGAADLSQRFGANDAFGARINVSYAHLDPQLRNATGKRHLAALATDWRLGRDTLVEAEFETSHRSQPSQPGFSLLGDRVPEPGDPRINLNNQPWSQPVVMDADNASVRLTQRFAGWQLGVHGATQRLRTDDRLAFPFGCDAEGNYDRYCSDGTYDLYDFRSENERRRTDALQIAARGDTRLAGMQHQWEAGTLLSRVKNRFGYQTFDLAGVGNVEGTLVTPPNDVRGSTNTNRDERSTEFFVRDAIQLSDGFGLWLGARHTRLKRESVQNDGSEPSGYEQSFNTPFAAATYTFARDQMAYASWGRGTESDVAPRLPQYTNNGQALPAAKSRQVEVGLKVTTAEASWGIAWFDIERPAWGDVGPCNGSDNSCTRTLDGVAHHRGIEAQAAWRSGPWGFIGSVMVLKARREEGTVQPELNGKRPTNVPERSAKLQVRYQLPQVAGLSVQADALGVSNRAVLEDNSAHIPGYGVADLGLRYERKHGQALITWRAGVDNLFDRRAWRESPFQFGHAYLYPLAGRTFRISVDAAL